MVRLPVDHKVMVLASRQCEGADGRWKSLFIVANQSESQLIALTVAILSGLPISELTKDSQQ